MTSKSLRNVITMLHSRTYSAVFLLPIRIEYEMGNEPNEGSKLMTREYNALMKREPIYSDVHGEVDYLTSVPP